MIVDAHAHFWKHTGTTHKNIGAYHDPIPVERFIEHMDAAGVDKLIQLTHGTMGFDNSYSLEGAAQYPDRIRVMGRLDATAPDVLEQLRLWRHQPYMAGLRLMTISEVEAPWWDDGTLDRLWPVIERLRIPTTIGAPLRSGMLGEIAQRHPGLPIIVDHAGMRVIDIFDSPPTLDDWPNLLALRHHENVYIKVSALPEAMVEKPPFTKSQGMLREIYDNFGPDRMIWGSNFPRITQVCSYRDAQDVVLKAPFLSADDKSKIMGGTITKVLGLDW